MSPDERRVWMAVSNPYPEGGRGIRTGQSFPLGSGACGGVPTGEPTPVSACDYERTVAGVRVGVRLLSVPDMEALGYYGVGLYGVCGASLVVGEDALEALSEEFSGEGFGGTGLAIARAVFGESADPIPLRDHGSGGLVGDTFVLSFFPEDAPDGLVEDVLSERGV